MTQPKDKLAHLQTTFHCNTHWDAMAGTRHKRFCTECDKHVYDFSQMTRREVEAVLEASRGKLCARITRQPDGSIQVQEDVPPTLHLISRRASPLASAVVSALLGCSPVMATGAPLPVPLTVQNDQAMQAQKASDGATASLAGTVVDQQNAVIPDVALTLTNSSGSPRTTQTSAQGEYRFENLPAGTYLLRAEAKGFKVAILTDIVVQAGQQHTVTANLQLNVGEVTMGIVAADPDRPLRVLYEKSDLVVDALVGKSVPVETERETKRMKTALHVNEVIKGQIKRKVIYFYHWEYDLRDTDFHYGDQLLVFLNPREKGQDGYELSDTNRGLKKLSARDLASYTLRLQELAALTNHRKPDAAELVDWLVRCANDPATRWEGVADLREGFRELQACEEEKQRKAEEAKTTAEQAVAALLTTLDEAVPDEPDLTLQFARLLTAAQKERLTQTALALEKPSGNDFELLALVAHWDKARLIPYALGQLRTHEALTPYDTGRLCQLLADLFDDEDIEKLVEPCHEEDWFADQLLLELNLLTEKKEELKEKAALAPAKRRATIQQLLRLVELKQRTARKP